MNFISRLLHRPPAAPPRRVLDVETVKLIFEHAIKERTQANCKTFWTMERMAAATHEDIETASARSFAPWSQHRWECEQQAMSLIVRAQQAAANRGHSIAAGMLFADPPEMFPDARRHVYVWALVGMTPAIFDPTTRRWCEIPANIYFALT